MYLVSVLACLLILFSFMLQVTGWKVAGCCRSRVGRLQGVAGEGFCLFLYVYCGCTMCRSLSFGC